MISQWIKFLDSVIPTICDINVSMFVYCDTLGVMELPVSLTFFTITSSLFIAVVNLNTVIEIIGKN